MNYYLTQYCFPLENKICISKKLNLFLTNPTTEDEIKEVRDFFKKSNEYIKGFPPTNSDVDSTQYMTIESSINEFKKAYETNNSVKEFFEKEKLEKDVYQILAKMTIILKFDESGMKEAIVENHIEMKNQGILGFTLLEDTNPLIINSKNAINYSFLLSLLLHTESNEYYGRSFLVNNKRTLHELDYYGVEFSDFLIWFIVTSGKNDIDEKNESSRWLVFPLIKKEILETTKYLDIFCENENNFKIIDYVSEILKNCSVDITDNKYKIITLVSIIEMLLTHNPDFNRFNVEDSIGKQFKLKLGILLYLENKEVNFIVLEKKLQLIYTLRSNIAHGNFNEINKTIVKFYEFYKKEIDDIEAKDDLRIYIEFIISDLYKYVKVIINKLIRDKNFIDFIKKN